MDSQGALPISCSQIPEFIETNETNMITPNHVPKQRKLRSAVWNDMTKQPKEDGSYFAICNHCKKKIPGSSSMGTTHLKNHLRFCQDFKNSKNGNSLFEASEKDGAFRDFGVVLSLPKRRKLRSAVWNEMTKEHRGDGSYFAVCNHCKKKMVGNSASGTTHLKNHLRLCPSFRNVNNDNPDAVEQFSFIPNEEKNACTLPRRRKLRSAVWNDMTKEEREDGSYFAICNHCNKRMVGNSARGTTHLKNHLRFCVAFKRAKSSLTDEVGSNSLDCFEFDPERSRRDFARMLILHDYPVSIVDHVGLRRFLRNLQPQFQLMSRDFVRDDCIGVYREEKKKLREVLLKSRSKINLAVGQCSGYLCLTCHFVDDDFRMHKRILSLVKIGSSSEILRVVEVEASDWLIWDKVFGLVLEDCSLERESVAQGPVMLPCWAHTLDLIVEESLKVSVVNNILERIRGFMKCLGKSRRLLPVDSPLSWKSMLGLLEAAFDYREFLTQLTDADWVNVRAIVDFLCLFREVKSKLSSCSKKPTINYFFIDLCSLYLKSKEFMNGPGPIQPMADRMLDRLTAHLNRINPLLVIGTILDPRFKMKSIDFLYEQIYYDNCSERIYNIQGAFLKVYSEYEAQYKPILTQPKKSDVDFYLEDDVIISNDDPFDVLRWWMQHAERFPVLSKMARDILSIPVSTESGNSRSVDFFQRCIDPEMARSLSCAKDWLRCEIEESLEDESLDDFSSIFSVINQRKDEESSSE